MSLGILRRFREKDPQFFFDFVAFVATFKDLTRWNLWMKIMWGPIAATPLLTPMMMIGGRRPTTPCLFEDLRGLLMYVHF